MLPEATSLASLQAAFRWEIPARYNIGVDVCDKWAARDPERVALILDKDDRTITFSALRSGSNRLAHLLAGRGVSRGDRVGVLLPQRYETALAHIAAFKLGAISIPLFTLFGEDALLHRLADSAARAVVTERAGAEKLARMRESLPALATVIDVDDGFDAALSGHSEQFEPVDTAAEDPAVLIYTSGTTGPPKGALHAHRVLPGHLPGVELSHDFLPRPGDCFWTPADWAWIGGLLDVLLPALHHGVPVVVRRFEKFSGEAAFDLIARRGVRNAFLPPTALKLMRRMPGPPKLDLRSVASGGESLGAELLDWGRQAFGVTINEFYGQTECNMIVSSCSRIGLHRPGAMGWPVPGHDLAVLDANLAPCPRGVEGEIAVRAPDPVMMLGYWRNDAATREKIVDGWLMTGDRAVAAQDGALRFVGRDDDVISSAGYRIGPGEIEDCLLGHPAVALAGVVGKPDDLRGEIVVAFVVPAPGFAPGADLTRELETHVRTRLAAHEYPREIIFLDALPMTTTGKIVRRELRAMLQGA